MKRRRNTAEFRLPPEETAKLDQRLASVNDLLDGAIVGYRLCRAAAADDAAAVAVLAAGTAEAVKNNGDVGFVNLVDMFVVALSRLADEENTAR